MRIRSIAAATAVVAALLAGPAQAQTPHPCAGDAVEHARKLLAFHFDEDTPDVSVDDAVKSVGTVKALRGEGRFDVLEVWGFIYKAEYRMHFLYAQIPGTCALMGQEILEASDPY
ncbi:hypothetical protein QFZ27_002008 [Inquilinus ginsengisoli]|uniref:hypothetical protein n=1 Tax=Inquilinus ginsengisoli TaxID=363840 RepID=UPI003D1D45EA